MGNIEQIQWYELYFLSLIDFTFKIGLSNFNNFLHPHYQFISSLQKLKKSRYCLRD